MIIGEICFGNLYLLFCVCVSKIVILDNGCLIYFEFCESFFSVNMKLELFFKKISLDEIIGFFIEDKRFIEVMELNFVKDSSGRWIVFLFFWLN